MVCAMRDIKAMIDNVGDPDGDRYVVAIHRTALTPNGRARRMMLGPTAGEAIFFDDPVSILQHGEIVLAEGVETSLSMREFGYSLNLALGSSSGFKTFPNLAPAVSHIRVSAENDAASRHAVACFAERAVAAGQRVFVMRPKFGNDANDLLLEVSHASH